MQKRLTGRVIGGCAAVAVLATVGYLTRQGAPAPEVATSIPVPSAAERLAAVEKVVDDRNRAAEEEAARFAADGWELVTTPPPDRRVLDLDPGLLAEQREAELRTQIASTVPLPGHARNLAIVARTAPTPATRESAVLALGKIVDTDLAREALIGLLTDEVLGPDDLARRHVPALLRPHDLDDPAAARIAALLDHPRLTAAEKQQVAFNLALVGLRDGMTLDGPTLAALSPGARALLDEMTALGSRSFLAHHHAHPEHEPDRRTP